MKGRLPSFSFLAASIFPFSSARTLSSHYISWKIWNFVFVKYCKIQNTCPGVIEIQRLVWLVYIQREGLVYRWAFIWRSFWVKSMPKTFPIFLNWIKFRPFDQIAQPCTYNREIYLVLLEPPSILIVESFCVLRFLSFAFLRHDYLIIILIQSKGN